MRLQVPHFSDPRVDHGWKTTTIYGAACPDIFYNYDDRFTAERRKLGDERTKDSDLEKGSAEWWQEWLSGAYEKEVVLKHVIGGASVASCHPYMVFGTVDAPADE